jgi:hypothetical protein
MQKLLFALAFAISLVTPAHSQTTFGASDCGEWIKSQNIQKRSWLMGYLSGINAAHYVGNMKIDHLDKLSSADQAYVWMDNYCKQNPLNDLTLGGWLLFQELKSR